MLLEEKFLEFHRYASSHKLPLEAISVGDENKVLCEMHYAANAPRNIYSHTKSFTVTAVGLAIEEGKLSLEDHVAEVFKDKLFKSGSKSGEDSVETSALHVQWLW